MAITYTGGGVGGAIEEGIDEWLPEKAEMIRQDLLTLDAKMIKLVTVLTDAQIKALPTTPITLLASPGSNKRIKLLSSPSLHLQNSAGVYSNVNTTYAGLALAWNAGAWATAPIINDAGLVLPDINNVAGTTNVVTTLTSFLHTISSGSGWVVDLGVPYGEAIQDKSNSLWIVNYPIGNFVNMNAGSLGLNKGLELQLDNNGSGNLTGGHAANTLRVTLYYTIEDMTP